MKKELIMKISGIDKSFGSTHALEQVSVNLFSGEIRALIGENGSGKSTLSGVISGSVQPDSGTMVLFGKPYAPHSVITANENKVAMIVQEMATINGITVAANMFAGNEMQFSNKGIVNRKKMNQAALKALECIGITDIDPTRLIDAISFEDRKMVEMARALYYQPEILIVDETTTALSQRGREILYTVMRKMKEKGKTVLFISHDLSEIMEQCDCVTVMRDGKVVATLEKDEMSVDKIRFLMIGRDINDEYYRADKKCSYNDEVTLRFEDVCAFDTVQHISFGLHKGEILGIGGLTDSGMHDVGKVAFGLIEPDNGKVVLPKENVVVQSPMVAIRNGVGYVSKNRDQEALMLSSSIRENIVLPSLNRLKKGFVIKNSGEKKLAKSMCKMLDTKMNSINQHCMYLSGGNKQKVALSKWIGNESDILILDCPTRGIDIGVKQSIYKLMQELKAAGKSILMISEEMPELLGMCDTVVIMKDGKISKSFTRDEEPQEADIIKYMIS